MTLESLVAESIASRLWQRDPTLWPHPSPGGDPPENTLGWLDLPDRMPRLAEQFSGLASSLIDDGFTDAVVLGMGGSSMTPLTLSSIFSSDDPDQGPDRSRGLRLHALDTVNPNTINGLTGSLDLTKTLFFVSSKSGTTVEPLSLESHFRSQLASEPGSAGGRRNFVALTDSGTPLSQRARAGEFGTWVATPEDVGGRFSGLSAFGMMPAAVAGMDIRRFAEEAAQMAQLCRADTSSNPGLRLGAFLGANAMQGRNKVTLLNSTDLAAFGMWVEQLLAESTGKKGKGLVPISGENPYEVENYGDDRQFVVIDTDGAGSPIHDLAKELELAGHPVLIIEVPANNKYRTAGEFFRWEFAVAVASSIMSIYPFDQPDVEAAKVKSRELLSSLGQNIDTGTLHESLKSLLGVDPPGYVAITAFLHESTELTAEFTALRAAISENTLMATTFGYGPRYLHSIGQLYKGGPQNAVVLGFVSGKYNDLAVPGETYTFGQLNMAQAGGDFAVMAERGQRVLPIELENDPVHELKRAREDIFG